MDIVNTTSVAKNLGEITNRSKLRNKKNFNEK